jgi:hypothetical protein
MKRITIDFIEQKDQRYETVGDYTETETEINFRITRFDNPIFSQAVTLHEMVEYFRNIQEGITPDDVDAFDLDPVNQARANESPDGELGWLPDCPCHKQHVQADSIERLFVLFSNEDWLAYNEAIEQLFLP